MPDLNFTDAYKNTVKAGLSGRAGKGFDTSKEWTKIIDDLKKAMGSGGPAYGKHQAFDDLRSYITGKKFLGTSEAATIFAGAKTGGAAPDAGESRDRCAALAMAKHIHLVRQAGGQDVWVIGTPNSYEGWPLDDLTKANTITRLNDTAERLDSGARKNLAEATQNSVAWLEKALVVASDPDTPANKTLIERWFCFGEDTDKQVKKAASKLKDGLKKCLKVAKSHKLILTDCVPWRSNPKSANWEAFVFTKKEKLDVVYIEQAFFRTDQMLSGLPHWTRILIHELTHREVRTDDVFYAWAGIGPSAGFPHDDAMRNADSWAWFCADANGALTDGVRQRALKTHAKT